MAFIVGASMTLSSCGLGTTGVTGNTMGSTGNTAGSGLLSNALTAQQGASTSILGSVLSNLLQGTTTRASLQGTWTYNAPKVVFESENVLAQLGSAVASSKIESYLSTYLAKVGMTAGKSSFTFNNDGTVIFTLNGRQTQGTYTYNEETKQLTLTGAFGIANLTCYATVVGNELDMVFDASKLLSIATNVASANTTSKTLGSLLGNFSGLKLGWAMTK